MKILEKIVEYGLYSFVFLLPWQTRLILTEGDLNGYWEYGTKSIYATEILLWFIFLLAAVWWAVNKLKIKTRKGPVGTHHGSLYGNEKLKITPKQNKFATGQAIKNFPPKADVSRTKKSAYLLICLFAFLLYSFLSVFWADSRSIALYAWHWLVEGVGLFLVLQIIKFDLRKIAWSFIFSALLQAGLGVWQFLTQTALASKWLGMAAHDPVVSGTIVVETALRRWLRAYGGLPHPNMLAGFLALAMFLTIWLYQKTDYGIKKLFLSAIFIFLNFGLLATFSKSVVGSFVVVMILWWVIFLVYRQSKETKTDLLKFTLIFLVVAVIFSVVFWEPVSTRFLGSERLEIKSTSERISYLGEAWQIIKTHPLSGVGLGNYTLAVHNEINPDLQSWDYQPVHNIYLLVLAELGIVGFVLWLALIAVILFKNFKLSLFVTRYPLLITLLIIGLFDHYLWTLYFGVALFWLCLGVAHRPISQEFDKPLDKH